MLEHVPDLLQGFAAFDNTQLDAAIDDVLARLGTIAAVDRVYVFIFRRLREDVEVIDNTHEWCAAGIEPQIASLQAIPAETVSFWIEPMRNGRVVDIPRVSDLPPDRPERPVLEAQSIQSLLVMPLLAAGALTGFVGFDAVRAERHFSAGEQLLLRAVTDAIGSAMLRQQATAELSNRERRYRLLARHSADLVVTVDPTGELRELSATATAMLGMDAQPSAQASLPDHVHPDDRSRVSAAITAAVLRPGEDIPVGDLRLRHRDGSWRWLVATIIDLRAEPGVDGIVFIAHDITERKAAESALEHQALHDPLTGLPNRTLLLDRLQHALERARRRDTTVAVLFLDVDRFKVVNDSLGHASGDELLRAYGRRLTGASRGGDTVARFGGDEFVVVLDEIKDRDQAWRTAERLLATLEVPFEVDGRRYRVTSSAGLVLAGGDDDAASLLRDADTAMYQAKAGGRQRIAGLDAARRLALLEEAELATALHGIDQRGELSVDYQPIFCLADGRCVGYEALARWDHPRLGRVPPGRFVPLAEEYGAIDAIGGHVLEHAVGQLLAWDQIIADHHDRIMAVNLSVCQLGNDRLVTDVDALLSRTGLAPGRLQLELTESTLMAEPAAARRLLGALRELGVGVAIDDFGTGYSSLASLRELPVSTLKVDRSFVTELGRDARDARVVSVVLGLAREFGLDAVAEGIETELQREELIGLGCRYGQGYLLARPAPPETLEAQTFMPMARSSSRT